MFKTMKCTNENKEHNKIKCWMYHDETKDRRRKLGTYRSERCQFIMKKKLCPEGDRCTFAHNMVEEFYHPEKYKAKFCGSYTDKSGICKYGSYCSFAHSEAEISVDLIDKYERDADFYMFHFKTAWCPYNEDDHARDICVFAHNWQDYRRKPYQYPYSYI